MTRLGGVVSISTSFPITQNYQLEEHFWHYYVMYRRAIGLIAHRYVSQHRWEMWVRDIILENAEKKVSDFFLMLRQYMFK